MNVLIVDDEPIIRVGLKTLVDWQEHGFRLVGEAADGAEALEWVRREPVDIVITDIRMPKMDGLQLMREVKAIRDDVGLLVLSCLDDFAYVKEAMKLGAQDYILKPAMEPEGLVAVLENVREKLDSDRRTKRAMAEWQEQLRQSRSYRLAEWLKRYMQTGAEAERLEEELFPHGLGAFGVWIEADPEALPPVEELAAGESRAVIRWSERCRIVVFDYDRSLSALELHERMYAAARRVYAHMQAAASAETEADWCVCLGPAMPKLSDFPRALHYHQRQMQERFYGRPDRFVTAEPGSWPDAPLPHGERSDFLRAVANGNREAAIERASTMLETIRRGKPDAEKVRTFVHETLALAYGLSRGEDGVRDEEDDPLWRSFERIRTIGHIDPLCAFVSEAVRSLWAQPFDGAFAKRSNNPFIRKAIRFMHEHYHRNIGAVDIAEHVKLSRSYLSDLFSKETGESLIETLTRIRIEEAKRKLRSGEQKVYEIAESVGFSDPKSFAKTFKRLVGCTPKEYESAHK